MHQRVQLQAMNKLMKHVRQVVAHFSCESFHQHIHWNGVESEGWRCIRFLATVSYPLRNVSCGCICIQIRQFLICHWSESNRKRTNQGTRWMISCVDDIFSEDILVWVPSSTYWWTAVLKTSCGKLGNCVLVSCGDSKLVVEVRPRQKCSNRDKAMAANVKAILRYST